MAEAVPALAEPVVERVIEIRPGDPAHVTISAAPSPARAGLTPLEALGVGSVPGLAGLLAALLVLRARRRDEEALAIDELTGVLRRGTGLVAAAREVERARRHGERLSAAFIDVDGLKRVNDSRGHAAGDQLLRAVAAALSSRLRGEDLVLRYGGDEFVCLLPGASGATAARLLAGVRDGLAARAGVVFSFGLAELAPGESLDHLLARADAELYSERSRRRSVR